MKKSIYVNSKKRKALAFLERFKTLMLVMIIVCLAAVAGAMLNPDFGRDAFSLQVVGGLFCFGLILGQGWPGKCIEDGTQPGSEHAEDVSPLVKIFSVMETPLLDLLGLAPDPAKNIRFDWLEDQLIPDTDVLIANLNATDATTVIPVNDASIYQDHELINIGWEVCEITAVDEAADTITVTRGYGEEPAAIHASGETIRLLGEVSPEGGEAPVPQNDAMERPWNLCQIFNYSVAMSGTRKALIPYHLGDIGNEWDYTVQKRVKEALRDLEATIIFGDWRFAGGLPVQTPRRTMRGIVNFLRHGIRLANGTAVATPADCNRDMTGTAFTLDNFRDNQQAMVYNHGAREANILLVSPDLKVSVSRWKRLAAGVTMTTQPQDQRTLTEVLTVVETDWGPVFVVMVHRLPARTSILLSAGLVRPKQLVGRSFKLIDIGNTGDYTKKELVGEYSLEMSGASKGYHSLCYNWTP